MDDDWVFNEWLEQSNKDALVRDSIYKLMERNEDQSKLLAECREVLGYVTSGWKPEFAVARFHAIPRATIESCMELLEKLEPKARGDDEQS